MRNINNAFRSINDFMYRNRYIIGFSLLVLLVGKVAAENSALIEEGKKVLGDSFEACKEWFTMQSMCDAGKRFNKLFPQSQFQLVQADPGLEFPDTACPKAADLEKLLPPGVKDLCISIFGKPGSQGWYEEQIIPGIPIGPRHPF